ncbi:hypothetical protein EUX98_g3440 [Antrodiella citrinella]|uniref:Glucanase n=1 Tax=Antrodiella citrinella TaxID=2447956 RepID=A0A4S4MXN5_9APHY|nr:hypothetical protein EUX98_g3440 [Antrodiella citrinella]
MRSSAAFFALVALLPALSIAQSPEWGQCGGINWTGATTCVAGTVCTEQNSYYSQCIPGSNTVPPSAPTTKPTVPPTTAPTGGSPTTAPSSTPTSVPSASNPFVGYQIYLSPYYVAEVQAAAAQITDPTVAAKALSVADIPNFTWFDQVAKVPELGTYLADAQSIQNSTGQKQLVQIVVYDLPDRDCAALASNGEFSIADGGEADYYDYIDQLVAQIKQYPDVRVVAVIEPDSLANLVTNLSVQKCANAQTTYLACINYALEQLSAVGVYSYMDAGHAGWLGWPANLPPAAQLFAQVYKNAGSSPFIRGLATNVANYNALTTTSPDPITSGDPNYDELLYIEALAPVLQQQGFPATFIVDQGRSGQQNLRQAWGDWCNIKGAGFGLRPSTNTPSPLIDSIVWVKPGGECDGTSNSSSPRHDPTCSLSDADQPSPEAGTWFQAYFETLVQQANPPLADKIDLGLTDHAHTLLVVDFQAPSHRLAGRAVLSALDKTTVSSATKVLTPFSFFYFHTPAFIMARYAQKQTQGRSRSGHGPIHARVKAKAKVLPPTEPATPPRTPGVQTTNTPDLLNFPPIVDTTTGKAYCQKPNGQLYNLQCAYERQGKTRFHQLLHHEDMYGPDAAQRLELLDPRLAIVKGVECKLEPEFSRTLCLACCQYPTYNKTYNIYQVTLYEPTNFARRHCASKKHKLCVESVLGLDTPFDLTPFKCTHSGCLEEFNREDLLAVHIGKFHTAENRPGAVARKTSSRKKNAVLVDSQVTNVIEEQVQPEASSALPLASSSTVILDDSDVDMSSDVSDSEDEEEEEVQMFVGGSDSAEEVQMLYETSEEEEEEEEWETSSDEEVEVEPTPQEPSFTPNSPTRTYPSYDPEFPTSTFRTRCLAREALVYQDSEDVDFDMSEFVTMDASEPSYTA